MCGGAREGRGERRREATGRWLRDGERGRWERAERQRDGWAGHEAKGSEGSMAREKGSGPTKMAKQRHESRARGARAIRPAPSAGALEEVDEGISG